MNGQNRMYAHNFMHNRAKIDFGLHNSQNFGLGGNAPQIADRHINTVHIVVKAIARIISTKYANGIWPCRNKNTEGCCKVWSL